ncbi:InlB B-repeat-containing protein [Infirmifilum sp. NZ]|uniref:InlB B-repeat-containing protein n=1 Tax=Infirmifilum sp. NZ TaxID=2926850 RepID=UPI0027A2B014|nr:hypothetical protein [Infirmifilum sp. NZ]UNQ73009.1 hypothetical protein MOV14_07840 [Infirmifilum sp. NZ]
MTIILALIAAILLQYMRSQTELQAIATQTQSQRAGEGVLSLSIADTYTNTTSTLPLVNALEGRLEENGTLDALDGKGLVFTPINTTSGYMLQVNFTTELPANALNATQTLYLKPSTTLNVQVFTKTTSGVYTALSTYLLPAGTTTKITIPSHSYILSAQATSNFTLLLDSVETSMTMYNTTGFYLHVRNTGPGYTAIHGLWVITNTTATRIPLTLTLPPGDTAKIPVNVKSSTIKEVRVVAITRVYILRPTPPLLAGNATYTTGILLLSVYPPGSGSTDPAPGSYVYPAGSRVRVSASPGAGYVFAGWLLNGSAFSTSPEVEVVVAGVVNLTAVFQPLQPPRFSILSYNSSISGAVGSRQLQVVTVNNTGQQAGVARVEVYDHNSNLVNSTELPVAPAAPQTASLTVTLPSARGTYTWTLKVKNLATNSYDDSKSIVVTARDLLLQSRGAVIYEDFESTPSGWTQLGGTWNIVSSGWRGSALYGKDDGKGPGGASVFANSSQTPSTVKAIVKIGNVVGKDNTYMGFALLSSLTGSARLYEVALMPNKNILTLYIRSYTDKWHKLATSQNKTLSGNWYTLYLEFSAGQQNSISAYLYDSDGNLMASASASDSAVNPSNIGLIVDGKDKDTVFDDLVVTSGADPRYVVVSGLEASWRVQLLDSSMSLCAEAAADASGVARLSVINCTVLRNATIRVLDQSGNTVIQKTFPVVVGGDTYTYG